MDIEKLFRSSYGPLCLYAMHYMSDIDTAEEVVHDCFVRFVEKISERVHFASPGSYLHSMVHNACLERLGHDVRQAEADAESTADMSASGVAYNGELQLAPDHCKPGCFDTERAWQRLRGIHVVRRYLRHRYAVSMARAAALGLASAVGITGYCMYTLSPGEAPYSNVVISTCADSVQCDVDTTDIFCFDNTPVNEALGAISELYGVELSASDTTKKVSGEIEISSVAEAIGKIETMAGIKITKKQ